MLTRVARSLPWLSTFGRLPLLCVLIWSIDRHPAMTWVWVTAIAGADVLDGVVARRLGSDTKARRTADAVLDRICIHSAFAVAVLSEPEFLWLYFPLLARDVVALTASGWLLGRERLLLLGGRWHKLSSLSCAAFGIAVVSFAGPVAYAAGGVATAINYVLLVDYAGGYLLYRRMERHTGRFKIRRLDGVRLVLGAPPRLRRRRARSGSVRALLDGRLPATAPVPAQRHE